MSEGSRRLRRYNLLMGILHLIQGIAIIVLANDLALPITATFMEGPPGTKREGPAWRTRRPAGEVGTGGVPRPSKA